MKAKFIISIIFGLTWTIISITFSLVWVKDVASYFPSIYVWWTIIGIALLPGFLMSIMFFSNLLNFKLKTYPNTNENVTIIICAHNEEKNIQKSISHIFNQIYLGHIHLLVIDNASKDNTKQKVIDMKRLVPSNCTLQYVKCNKLGKSHALNLGISLVDTPYFITVDSDTCIESSAVQKIMNHITYNKSACTAGNLFVKNAKSSLVSKMQNYDYLLSIAAVKRFQGSYNSTLVAQGAFSAYQTELVRQIGGWQDVMGEDIVLTYQLLSKGLKSTYEPQAVGYTIVPETFDGFYNQRKRWAMGMLEGLSTIYPWKQKTLYSKYFTHTNLVVIYLDLAFLFGFVPGVILAICGYCYLVGLLTLITFISSILIFASVYIYQKKLGIYFQNSIIGFIFFLLLFQFIQSMASLHGYTIKLLRRKEQWK